MKRLILMFLAMGTLITTLLAADISGKWKAEFSTPDGTARTNTFTFKVEGEKLTGSVAGSQDETPIQDGKVSGDDVSFTADRPFGKFTYKGKVVGGEIKLKVEFGDNSFDIVAKRVN
jgi:hypothetical protein